MLPSPTEKLAGCVWLPRITAKARLIHTGDLPAAFAERFCHPSGVDGQFLGHFQLDREQILATSLMTAEQIETWFLALPGITPARVEEWNHIAINLGRPCYPMAERLPIALATAYQHLADQHFETVFQVLAADDALES